MPGTKRFNTSRIVKKLNQVRSDITTVPPPCICDPISFGCKCGRFEYEMALKNRQSESLQLRDTAWEPQPGDVYIISRDPSTDIDHAKIPFKVWAKCEGKRIEITQVEPDNKIDGYWWCWVDVSHITKDYDDEYWFPSDSLLKP